MYGVRKIILNIKSYLHMTSLQRVQLIFAREKPNHFSKTMQSTASFVTQDYIQHKIVKDTLRLICIHEVIIMET